MGNETSAPVKAVTGHTHYQFGDITRGILGLSRPPSPPALSGAAVVTEARGRPAAPPPTVTGAHPVGPREAAPRRVAPPPAAAVTALSSKSAMPPKVRAPSEGSIWDSFFNRSYELGEACMRSGAIRQEDLEDREAYLYLGLPALTLLEGVNHSLGLVDAMVMSDGAVVTRADCPPEFLPLYSGLVEVKTAILDAGLSGEEVAALRLVVLYAGHDEDRTPLAALPPDRCVAVNRIAAAVQGIATVVTQKSFFKAAFENVLELLDTSCAPAK